jgi:hypothetical protein
MNYSERAIAAVAAKRAGGGSQVFHGIMGNAIQRENGVNVNYSTGQGNPEWVAIYDTDGYADDPTPDFFQIHIPAGLGGMYLLEAIIYMEAQVDLTGATFILQEPSDSGYFDVTSSNVQPFVGGVSFVRPLQDGDRVRMDLGGIGGVSSVVVGGGDLAAGVFTPDVSLSNFTLSRIGELPSGWAGY